MRFSYTTPYLFAAIVVILGANIGLTEILGAHPFWAVSIAWVGVPIGLIAAFVVKHLGWSWRIRSLTFLVCLAIAYGVAHFGKDRFAASFAEDALAGRMWYFGWIAVAATATASMAAIFSPTKS